MTRNFLLPLPIVGLFLCVACGGATNTADEASATTADVQTSCDAICEQDGRCDPDPGAPGACKTDCLDDSAWFPGQVRADLLHALASCYASLTCEESDDICTQRALESVGLSKEEAGNASDVQACLAKQNECERTADSFSDDNCGRLLFLVAGSRARAAACYEKPCAEIKACEASVFGD